MKHQGLSFVPFFISFFLGFSSAATLSKSPGLTNNKTYDDKSFITGACISDSFLLDAENVYNSSAVPYYQSWTELHLREHLASGSRNEIEAVGTYLFGVPNYECLLTTGHCTPQPTCESIAEFMGLKDDTQLTPEDVIELRNRYFLSEVFTNSIQFSWILWVCELYFCLSTLASAKISFRIALFSQRMTCGIWPMKL